MDALPILENTGSDYASTKTTRNAKGKEVPVMHACGHDMHTATLLATATLLHAARPLWTGTLIRLFQPDEETACGAQSDGRRWVVHKAPSTDSGHSSWAAYSDAQGRNDCASRRSYPRSNGLVRNTHLGKGGHGARPDLCIDPIFIASHIVTRLQTIVSREVRPGELAVISCGSIHGGVAANIIPDYVDLKLTARAYSPQVQQKLLEGVERVVRFECQTSGATEKPTLKTIMHAPVTFNDPAPYEVLN